MVRVSRGLLAGAVVLAVLTGCAVPGVVAGSGTVVTRQFDLSGFRAIEAGHGCRLEVTPSAQFGVEVDVNDNLEEYLEVRVSGDRLRIRLKPGRAYAGVTLRARVSLPELRGLDLSGGTQASAGWFETDADLDLDLSGGSQLRGEISGGDATVDLSGGSKLELYGTAGDLRLDASGGSKALLAGWSAGDVQVDASGGSQVAVHASGRLSGEASGGSRVEYSGGPTSVDVETSGGSRVVEGTDQVTRVPVIAWHREGGIAGFCDDLYIYGDGRVEAESCRSQPPASVGRGELPEQQLGQLDAWRETYKPFKLTVADAASADAMVQELVFAGSGGEEADEAVRQEMMDLAAELFADLSVGATPTPEVFIPLPAEERAFEAARQALAAKLGVEAADIRQERVEAVDWPDGCLGAAGAGEMCTEVITPGYRVLLEAGGTVYEVRTNLDASVVRLAGP